MTDPGEDAGSEETPPGDMPSSPPCPFCDGRETELLNAFGPHASVASYWCRSCRSPFEFMKWGEGEGGDDATPASRPPGSP